MLLKEFLTEDLARARSALSLIADRAGKDARKYKMWTFNGEEFTSQNTVFATTPLFELVARAGMEIRSDTRAILLTGKASVALLISVNGRPCPARPLNFQSPNENLNNAWELISDLKRLIAGPDYQPKAFSGFVNGTTGAVISVDPAAPMALLRDEPERFGVSSAVVNLADRRVLAERYGWVMLRGAPVDQTYVVHASGPTDEMVKKAVRVLIKKIALSREQLRVIARTNDGTHDLHVYV